jgi:hypothetical protein
MIVQVAAEIDGFSVSPADLGIPDWVPEAVYASILDTFNSTVEGVAGGVRGLEDTVLPQIDDFVDTQVTRGQEYLATMQEAVAEGGEVEAMIQGAYDQFTEMVALLCDAIANWDPDIRPDFTEAVSYLRGLADQAALVSPENRMDGFREFMQNTAQSEVDAWRSAHGPTVETIYQAEVPAAEMSAVDQAYELIVAKLVETEQVAPSWSEYNTQYRSEAEAAYSQCQGSAGQKGQAALESFWDGADDLARIGSMIRA